MGELSLKSRVAAIVEAVKKASLEDLSLGVSRTGRGDILDVLVDEIEDLLRRCCERVGEVAPKVLSELDPAGTTRVGEGLSSEQILEILEKNIPDTIHFKDVRGHFTHVSWSNAKAFGLQDPAEAIGKTDFDFFTEEHAREAAEDEQRILRTGEPLVNKEERETWPNRPDSWVLTTKMPLRDQQGAIVGTFGISRDITQLKRVQESLEKSELRYRTLFSANNDMILVHPFHEDLSPEPLVEVNDVACERLGYSREELLHMSTYDIDAPEGLATIPAAMATLRAEGQAVWEGVHQRKDGRKIPVEITNRLFELDGKPMILATIRDITEQKEAEEALRKREERYRLLFNSSNDVVLVHGIAPDGRPGKITEANDVACELLGYSRDELIRMSPLDLDAPETVERVPEVMARLKTEKHAIWEGVHVGKAGRRIPVEISNHLFDLDGEPTIFAAIRDISGRKKLEQTIESERSLLLTLIDSLPDYVYLKDRDSRFVLSNRAQAELLGVNNPAELIGKSVHDFISKDLADRYRSDDLRVMESGVAVTNVKEPLEIARGGQREVLTTKVPILDEAGAVTGLVGISRDITELSRVEQERVKLQEQLQQSQKMEAIGVLAGGIAHDFNNILQAIIGYCEILELELPRSNQKYVTEITKAAQRAAALTARLLAFSRKQTLRPEVVDTKDLIRSVHMMLERVIGEDIELRTLIDPGTGNFLADPGQMVQVLLNLAVNSRDAMPSGGKLTIETSNRTLDETYVIEHPGAKAGQYIRIAVSDTGVGMDHETLSRVFEPFFTTKEKGKGTGLGLSTVYGIVKQSEGYINCYTELGKGTTFTIYLPQSSAQVAQPLTRSDAPAPKGTETILLVDDDSAVRSIEKHALEEAGDLVIEASGGEEALALVSRGCIEVDILVTDVVMPRMSGKELAQKLTGLCPSVKVIYVSGYPANVISYHGILEAGLNFLQKPFGSIELLAKVRKIIDGESPPGQGK